MNDELFEGMHGFEVLREDVLILVTESQMQRITEHMQCERKEAQCEDLVWLLDKWVPNARALAIRKVQDELDALDAGGADGEGTS